MRRFYHQKNFFTFFSPSKAFHFSNIQHICDWVLRKNCCEIFSFKRNKIPMTTWMWQNLIFIIICFCEKGKKLDLSYFFRLLMSLIIIFLFVLTTSFFFGENFSTKFQSLIFSHCLVVLHLISSLHKQVKWNFGKVELILMSTLVGWCY